MPPISPMQGPAPGAPGAAPPGGAPPPPPPAGPPATAPGSAMLDGLAIDLSHHLPPGYQLLDAASRCLEAALNSADFEKTPEVVALIRSVNTRLQIPLSAYRKGAAAERSGSHVSGAAGFRDTGSGVDADAQPRTDSNASSSGDDDE